MNLDGAFDSADIVAAVEFGRYCDGALHPMTHGDAWTFSYLDFFASYLADPECRPAGWRQGDWNGDGAFDSSDLVTALESGYAH